MTTAVQTAAAPAVARDCHSLVVRPEGPFDAASARRRLAEGAGRWPALAPLTVWETRAPVTSGHPSAQDRIDSEATRPLGERTRPVRVVLLRYADGRSDLVLVARRSVLARQALELLATLLTEGMEQAAGQYGDGADPFAVLARPAPATAPASARPEVDWGLGDPRRAGVTGAVPFAPPNPTTPADPVGERHLVGAAALVLARYRGWNEGIGEDGDTEPVEIGRPGAEPLTAYRVTTHEKQTVGEYLEQLAAPPGPAHGAPVVGVLVDDAVAGRRYLPGLAPDVPFLVHARRDDDGSYAGTCWFDEGLIAPRIARRLSDCIAHVAEQLASREHPGAAHLETAHPATALSDVELMTRADTEAVLRLGGAGAGARADGCVHRRFSEVAARQPNAVAVVDDKTELTFRQLDERADELARGLRALGVRAGDRIGLCLDRDATLVVTLLGILKAGCAYVPMDPHYPRERLRHTIENAGVPVVVGHAEQLDGLTGAGVRRADPEELRALGATAAQRAQHTGEETEPGGDAPAYVIYTSGSTGRPKGVVVPHRNVLSLVDATEADFGLGPHDTWTLFHSSAFDFSVWEVWGCLLTGGRLVVVPYWVTRDTEEFHELLADRRVTVLNQTPSAFSQLVRTDQRSDRELALRLVVFGGEPLDVRMLAPWFARHSHTRCRMVNMFGITETTVHVTAQTVTPYEVMNGSRSVGRALPGWSLSVRDRHGRILPPGPAGEICVGGAGVADRYLGLPDLTAERFTVDEATGERVYRSGDKGRLRPDGSLDHLGRLDSQVKIRGHRIELDEIRSVLLTEPSVGAAAVVVNQETPGDHATSRLDAYVVLTGAADPRQVLDHARRILPDYMTPSTVTPVPAIPLTVNGKLDTAQLPPPRPAAGGPAAGPAVADEAPPAESAAPGDDVAETVLRIWSGLFNRPVREEDNFFEIGGNSLLVVRVLAALRDAGLPKLTPRQFYGNSTAGQFIRLVREMRDAQKETTAG